MNGFLSWRAWIPLSKLTYSAYLVHYVVLLYNVGTIRTAGSFTTFRATHTFFGNLCLTMFVALCLSCCSEMPFMTLARQLLTPRSSKEPGRLATKPSASPSAELIFGSTDSGESIYRGIYRCSIEGLAQSKASSVDSVFTIGKGDECYGVQIEPTARTATRKPGEATDSPDCVNIL